jgi:hypothetical protein
MTILNSILSVLLFLCILLACWLGVINWRRFRAQQKIAEELDIMLKSTLEAAQRNKTAAEKWGLDKPSAGNGSPKAMTIEDLYSRGLTGEDDITSPQMLSTMLTVIVYKYGDLKLSLKDFMSVPIDEYISVYVDQGSKEIILSLNHELADDGAGAMAPFVGKDPSGDDTFH